MKADSPAFISRIMSLLLQLQLRTQVTVVKMEKKKLKFHIPAPAPAPSLLRAKGQTHHCAPSSPLPVWESLGLTAQHRATPNVSAESLEELKEPQLFLNIRPLPRAVD